MSEKAQYYTSKGKNLSNELLSTRTFDDDGNELWFVEKILEKKWIKKEQQYKYKIQWKGWGPEDCTWEPIENLGTIPDMVHEFNVAWEKEKRMKGKYIE